MVVIWDAMTLVWRQFYVQSNSFDDTYAHNVF